MHFFRRGSPGVLVFSLVFSRAFFWGFLWYIRCFIFYHFWGLLTGTVFVFSLVLLLFFWANGDGCSVCSMGKGEIAL